MNCPANHLSRWDVLLLQPRGLQDHVSAFVLAHSGLGHPVRHHPVTATLVGFDRSLTRPRRTLGANRSRPSSGQKCRLILRASFQGGLFAFITSFDEGRCGPFCRLCGQKTLPLANVHRGPAAKDQPHDPCRLATILSCISICLLTRGRKMLAPPLGTPAWHVHPASLLPNW